MTKIGLLFYRFRTSNYWLPIEVGRWTNVERHNRLCQFCEIGDEFHYVLQCPNFVTERKIIIPKILFNRPSTLKLSSLFNKKKPETWNYSQAMGLEFFFFVAQNIFPEINFRLYDKNSESGYFFFLHQNQNICSATLRIRIFF